MVFLLAERLGTLEVDLFASRLNFKFKKFCSWSPDPLAWKPHSENFIESSLGPSNGVISGASMDHTKLVRPPTRVPYSISLQLPSKRSFEARTSGGNKVSTRRKNDPPSMQNLRASLTDRGFSEDATALYTASWWDTTVASYTEGDAQWQEFCDKKQDS
uniref:Uncharacterized protein n=1 Tax=Strigamia maritima TaxID=126957 RepID=T1IVX7_STRMM